MEFADHERVSPQRTGPLPAPPPRFPHRPTRRFVPKLALVLAIVVAPVRSQQALPPAAAPAGWVTVDYSELIDGRELSHSGEPVAELLRGLGGRPVPSAAGSSDDALRHALLDPILEPFAFVLSDAVDSAAAPPERPWIEVGALWNEGEVQPAWVELLRARSLVVESDGDGRLRVFVPFRGAEASGPSSAAEASRRAWDDAWPVLRHVLAAERRRLARRAGAVQPHLDVEARAFVHERERTRFRLAVEATIVRVDSTAPKSGRAPLDLKGIQSFLDRGLLLEGGRLETAGTLHLFGSDAQAGPSLLGRPIHSSDLAVAYRAVFHGGLAEPYMSLDKGPAPQISAVNYGGRLRDTALGLVSLLCDIRFKTFSLGIDAVSNQDVRARIRAELPEFRSHLERLAADPRSQGIAGQQTRLWFYPDSVELTLSEEADAMVMRRARMTASSERVQEGSERREDPSWTLDTVAAINRDYDRLSRFFPELADLDQAARLLALFAWLKEAEKSGLPLPDLDALLALELPSISTPRSFPQLLAFNSLPPPGSAGPVDVFSRLPVEEGLDRLLPAEGTKLAARRRFERALAALDRSQSDHLALAKELETDDRGALRDDQLDFLSYRAERLRMHRLVLATLPAEARETLAQRAEGIRVFSVGIGGLDLGMSKSVARARGSSREAIRWSGGAVTGESAALQSRTGGSERTQGGPAPSNAPASSAANSETSGLPETLVLDHGSDTASPDERARVSKGSGKWNDEPVTWSLVVYGADSPEASSRRIVIGRTRTLVLVERTEGARTQRYRLERDADGIRARSVREGLAPTKESADNPTLPAGLVTIDLPDSGKPSEETQALTVRLRSKDAVERRADLPRALVQRLVLGPESDLQRGQPLPGLEPASQLLGPAGHALFLQRPAETVPPWESDGRVVPGEEMSARVAAALKKWWNSGPSAASICIGTNPKSSFSRWESSPRPATSVLWVPDGSLTGAWSGLRDQLAALWKGRRVSDGSEAARAGALVILVSAEPPGSLAARIRGVSRATAFRGKLLAVYSLSGPVRSDLPAGLLAEGNLAGLGIAVAPAAGNGRVAEGLVEFSKELEVSSDPRRRIDEIPGPFLWYF